jgi:DNA polymerase-3 subunit gamma/tau
MTHELARHVEWLGMTQHQIRLRLAHKFAHLLPYQENLRTGLESVLDCDLNLSIELGEEEGTSVAQQEARTQAQAHQQALQTLTRDPFVQAVRDELGGALVESSVKPLPQGEKS